MKKFLWLTVLVSVLFVGGLMWFMSQLSPMDASSSQVVHLTVEPGAGVDKIGSELVDAKLVRSVWIFKFQVARSGLSKKIQAGDFDLSPKMSVSQLVVALTKGRSDKKVTLLEGWRREEIARELTDQLGIDAKEFLRQTQNMEGRLYPDTYSFPKTVTVQQVVDKLTGEFETQTKGMVNQSGLSDDQALVLASLIERESRVDSERPIIAGVLLNRFKANWPLQVDATLQYAKATVKCKTLSCDWWKNDLTKADLELKSSYNTYSQTGLPPTPICSPSLSSLKAAFAPQKTDYWFYLHDNQGQVHFAKTLAEHTANVAKFLGK